MAQFGFRSSPTVQLAVSTSEPSPPPPAATVPTATPTTAVTSNQQPPGAARSPEGSPPAGAPPAAPGRCCDTGRPLFTDPLTGQTVCSCQYDLLSYQQRLAASAGVAAAGIPALSMYSAPYTDGMAAYFPALGADQAPFYTSTAAGLELKENLATGAATWPYPSVYHPYDAAAFAGYPFNGYGLDMNGARRKNATRETTSTLKAWLNEHKKNPYPTKGEKIMLAIITKMTLTQVSTWFANARRRLKKENKMTWEPRNRVEDEDNNNEDDGSAGGRKSADNVKDPDSKDSGTGSSEDGDRTAHLGPGPPLDTGSEWSESRPDSPECLFERPPHLAAYHHHPLSHPRLGPPLPAPSSSPPPSSGAGGASSSSSASNPKPRIWSLADMAASKDDVHHHLAAASATPVSTSAFYAAAAAAGKLISPLANRGPIHPHHLHHSVHHPAAGAYPRPHHDFYRSFYAPAASHLAGGSGGGGPPGDVSLLETYSRTFGAAGLAPGGSVGAPSGTASVLSKAAVAAAAAAAAAGSGGGAPPFAINGSGNSTGGGALAGLPAASGASSASSSSAGSSELAKLSPSQDKLQAAPLNKA